MDAHNDLLIRTALPGCYPSEGAMYYVRQGKEIPEILLPGRALMRMNENTRQRYVNTNWQNVSPWWIKIMCAR
jgi:hypothetical protein